MRKGSLTELKAIFYFLIEWDFYEGGRKEGRPRNSFKEKVVV
jgi:hypothetical protein